MPRWNAIAILAGASSAVLTLVPTLAQDGGSPTFSEVAEILNRRCVSCHSGPLPPMGLALDSLDNLKAGSWSGPVVESGDPEGSELIRRIKGISQPRMPFNGPPFLGDAEIALIEGWVAAGMPEGDSDPAQSSLPAPTLPGPDEPVRFPHVEPIFLQRCVECHSGANPEGPPEGLRLTSRDEILAGGDRIVVVPGSAGASELVRRIKGQSLPRMPFDGPPFLDEDQIRLIVDWIEQGAPDESGESADLPVGGRVRLEGTLTARWRLDDTPLTVAADARIDDDLQVGGRVEVRGTVGTGGAIMVERIRSR